MASAEAAATRAGLDILAAGGNAVDAAVATALALAVVHPEAGNLGGGGFVVLRMGNELDTLDFRETAPAAARREMFLDDQGRPRKDASRIGPLSAGVPGSPKGLFALHQKYGSLTWKQVVEPAIRLANDGFVVSRRLHDRLVAKLDLLKTFPETANVWLPDGAPPAVGSVFRLPTLGATLVEYAALGPEALDRGPLAQAIERASTRYGGILTANDLAAYEPVWRRPVRFEAFGWQFASMDLPASGGIILGQAMQLLERTQWARQPRYGAARAHLLAEVLRRSYADRYLLGDPSSTEVTADQLLSPAWLDNRAAGIHAGSATPSSHVAQFPTAQGAESLETTHLSVADSEGNLVAMTSTLNGAFGCGLLVTETGFFLNNEMDDFNTAPGHPNLYDLIQGDANLVAPGRRMLSSMSPTIAWKGSEALALGGRGGSLIPTGTLQVLLHRIVDGDDLQTAIERPRIHHQWLPDEIRTEPDALSPETHAALESLGHIVRIDPVHAKVHAVGFGPDGRHLAAADPRGPGVAGILRPEL